MPKQKGAATLIVTVILLTAALLLLVFSAQYGVMQQKLTSNQTRANEAFAAAEAGLEFGLVYLAANSSTVTASPSNGYINYGASNSSLTNVTLSNNSQFSVVYTNPTQNNYQRILVTSTGTSADGTATKVISEQAYQQESSFTTSASALKNFSLTGGAKVENMVTDLNITIGGALTIDNGASTSTSSGKSSSQGNYESDVEQNVSTYSDMSETTYFQNVFGASKAAVQSTAETSGSYYSNAGPDYSQALNGKKGETIYINQTNGATVNIGQGVTIGSASNPVTLVVNGNLSIENGATIYGFVYASSPTSALNLAGGTRIYGGIASGGSVNISNGVRVTYTKYPLTSSTSLGTFVRVPGTWEDFLNVNS
jgi:Tfp pilus assembly protein PilX